MFGLNDSASKGTRTAVLIAMVTGPILMTVFYVAPHWGKVTWWIKLKLAGWSGGVGEPDPFNYTGEVELEIGLFSYAACVFIWLMLCFLLSILPGAAIRIISNARNKSAT